MGNFKQLEGRNFQVLECEEVSGAGARGIFGTLRLRNFQ